MGKMSFGLYLIGFVVLVVGVAFAAHLMNVPARWIGVIVLILLGLGIVTGVTTTRRRDPPG
jgi:peptidoglycan/LPS O-acetylase OafA/YrhL